MIKTNKNRNITKGFGGTPPLPLFAGIEVIMASFQENV